MSSLRYDADLDPTRPATDVLINGTAYAPGGRPSTEFVVGMRLGPIQKMLRVSAAIDVADGARWERCRHGHRAGAAGCRSSTSEPSAAMTTRHRDPRHHRLDPRNPVGNAVSLREQSI